MRSPHGLSARARTAPPEKRKAREVADSPPGLDDCRADEATTRWSLPPQACPLRKEVALACYRAFRDAGHLPPVMAAKTRARPSKALDRARDFAMAVRDGATYEDELSRLDALHDAGAGLGGDVRAALDWMIDRDATTASNPMISKTVELGELLTEPDEPVRWLVEDVMPAGGSSLVVAPPKAGKTTAARCLAVAVARGLSWLGRECDRGPVLYLALEERRDEVKRHFAKLGARPDDQIRVYVQPAPRDGLGALRGAVLAFKPVLVIVDPALSAAPVRGRQRLCRSDERARARGGARAGNRGSLDAGPPFAQGLGRGRRRIARLAGAFRRGRFAAFDPALRD